jgi:hypothetical protein
MFPVLSNSLTRAERSYFKEFVMAQAGNNQDRFGGQYMIQDRDHMSEISEVTETAQRGQTRQPQQSQSGDRQQGDGSDNASGQQGGERQRKNRSGLL